MGRFLRWKSSTRKKSFTWEKVLSVKKHLRGKVYYVEEKVYIDKSLVDEILRGKSLRGRDFTWNKFFVEKCFT